ncbi:hypothetical protein Tco_1106879 [Tanacetum coccineum]
MAGSTTLEGLNDETHETVEGTHVMQKEDMHVFTSRITQDELASVIFDEAENIRMREENEDLICASWKGLLRSSFFFSIELEPRPCTVSSTYHFRERMRQVVLSKVNSVGRMPLVLIPLKAMIFDDIVSGSFYWCSWSDPDLGGYVESPPQNHPVKPLIHITISKPNPSATIIHRAIIFSRASSSVIQVLRRLERYLTSSRRDSFCTCGGMINTKSYDV